MILEFLCGCRHSIDVRDPDDVGWWKETSTDNQGFLVCTSHRQRRKNWNALPEGNSKQMSDWSFARTTPLERERFEVYGTPITERTVNLDLESTGDYRDNRDPEKIGREILAGTAAKGNGHVEDN